MAVSSPLSSANPQITRVRKLRRLPLPGEVLVSPGERVTPDTIVAKISLKPGIPWVVPVARLIGVEPADLGSAMLKRVGDRVKMKEVIARAEKGLYGRKEFESPTDGVIEEISTKSGRVTIREEFGKEEPPVQVDVAFELGVRPKDVRNCLLRQIGEEVKKGQIFAKKGDMAAFFTKTAIAPISGIIESVNDQTGFVTIARPFKEVVVKAYIDGQVDEVVANRGAWVSTPAVRLTGIFGLGRETHGELKLVCTRPDEELTADRITPDCAGKIIVGGAFATNDALSKALAVGVKGVITGTASYLNIVNSLGVKLGVGITGQEDVGLTVILMEGFGVLSMRDEAFNTLRQLEGRHASINGATQIRAGAIRPEVIVAFPDYQGELAEQPVVDEELSIGLRVRIINDPWFGQMGTIVAVPREPRLVENEARVPVVEVKLESGETVTVPRPNVEVW
ncbi:MAG: hypothetical protein ACM3XN_05560 [Chloroflexota bacterium]